MHVPSQSWARGSWNPKLPQFDSLGRMVGLGPNPSSGELDAIIKKVSSAKVFADSTQAFVEETARLNSWSFDKARKWVLEELEHVNKKLGLMEPLPFMTMNDGFVDPKKFHGVALLPAGITNWSVLRHAEIARAHKAGAKFERVIVMWSSRKCNAPADLRHPLLKGYRKGREPNERTLMKKIIESDGVLGLDYHFAKLPRANSDSRPLSLEQQLRALVSSGQYAKLAGDGEWPLYVPSTPNSLYVPLHVRRVLDLEDVAFSQAGARLVTKMPEHFWESLQEIMTTPNGIFRLWIELRHAGCISD